MSEDLLCRYCQESIELPRDIETVISPCRCKGSLELVHVECLVKWGKTKCEMCKFNYFASKPQPVQESRPVSITYSTIFVADQNDESIDEEDFHINFDELIRENEMVEEFIRERYEERSLEEDSISDGEEREEYLLNHIRNIESPRFSVPDADVPQWFITYVNMYLPLIHEIQYGFPMREFYHKLCTLICIWLYGKNNILKYIYTTTTIYLWILDKLMRVPGSKFPTALASVLILLYSITTLVVITVNTILHYISIRELLLCGIIYREVLTICNWYVGADLLDGYTITRMILG